MTVHEILKYLFIFVVLIVVVVLAFKLVDVLATAVA